MFITSKDKIDYWYDSLQEYFKIEYDGDINKYLGIDLDHRPYVLVNRSQTYLNPGMNKSSANPNPEFKPPLEKYEGSQKIKMDLIADK